MKAPAGSRRAGRQGWRRSDAPRGAGSQPAGAPATLPPIVPLRPIRVYDIPTGREWIYELKLDGFRGVLHVQGRSAHFLSKKSNRMRRFDTLALALAKTLRARSAILDGEIIAMGEHGPDFKALFFGRRPPAYAAFDLLWLDGRDLRPLPLWRRKRALRKLVSGTAIGYVDDIDNPALFAAVAQRDLEGIVAKRRGDAYEAATRWLKVKCIGYSQMNRRWELFAR